MSNIQLQVMMLLTYIVLTMYRSLLLWEVQKAVQCGMQSC